MRTLSVSDLADVVEGAALLGSGGGGPIEGGRIMIEAIRTRTPGRVELIEAPYAGLPDDALGVVVADVGGADEVVPAQADATWNAFERLRATLRSATGAELGFVCPGEVGPENSLAPAWVAARSGLPLIDGDGARRALPVLEMASFAIHGIPPCPSAIAGPGRDAITLDAEDATALEALMRPALAAAAFADSAGMALWPMRGRQLRQAAVAGGLSLALEIGRTLRVARAKGADPLRALRGVAGLAPELLAKGTLGATATTQDAGFDVGRTPIRSADGTLVTLLSKNEILLAWSERVSAPLATVPDTIALLTQKGDAFTLAEAKQHEGETVLVLRIPCAAPLREAAFLAVARTQLAELGYLGPPVLAPPARATRARRAGARSRPLRREAPRPTPP